MFTLSVETLTVCFAQKTALLTPQPINLALDTEIDRLELEHP